MAKAKSLELYYNRKSKVLYVITPNQEAFFVTNDGHVGSTTFSRNVIVGGGGTYENARQVCELTPKTIRKISKVLE